MIEQQKMSRLKIELRKHMNGNAATSMREKNNCYKANYGLALGHIKEIAASFPLNPDECDDLWQTHWRDLMLIAIAAIGPDRIGTTRALKWALDAPSQEIIENLAFLCLQKSPDAAEIANALISRNQNLDIPLACHITARNIIARNFQSSPASQNDWSAVTTALINIATTTLLSSPPDNLSLFQLSSFGFLLRATARTNFATPIVSPLIDNLRHSNSPALTNLAQQYDDEKNLFL